MLYGKQLDGCTCIEQLRRVHSQIRDSGHESDRFLANQLVKMYGRLGSLEDARSVFENIRHPNAYSWNLIISACVRNGKVDEARSFLNDMPHWNVVASNALLTGYMNVGCVDRAELLFESMHEKDVISWTAMITGYAGNGHLQDASRVFESMPQRNLVSWNSIVSAYAQQGYVRKTEYLFRKMPEKDLVSWTAMITAYARNGQGEEALQTFRLMDLDGFTADSMALACVIDACTCPMAGKLLHGEVVASLGEPDVVMSTSLVKMFGKCFKVDLAEDVFERMTVKNILSWNAMIVAYSQNGRGSSAIHLFRAMDLEGLKPNQFTFASVFDACSSTGAVAEGRIIHASLDMELSSVSLDVAVGTSLVNLYGKYACLEEAKLAFDGIQVHNVLSVTAMVAAYSHSGRSNEALQVFRSLSVEGMEPDRIAFVTALSSCSTAGLLSEGWVVFVSMKDYGLLPGVDHYLCMIDLLGRAGKLEDAVELINTMPFEPDSVSWTSLLAGCTTQDDSNTRTSAAANSLRLDPRSSGSYQLLIR